MKTKIYTTNKKNTSHISFDNGLFWPTAWTDMSLSTENLNLCNTSSPLSLLYQGRGNGVNIGGDVDCNYKIYWGNIVSTFEYWGGECQPRIYYNCVGPSWYPWALARPWWCRRCPTPSGGHDGVGHARPPSALPGRRPERRRKCRLTHSRWRRLSGSKKTAQGENSW